MSFLLRAALVIAALSVFALREPGRPGPTLARETDVVSAALTDLPSDLSAQVQVRARQAAEAEILRRLAEARPSQDTLLMIDRRTPWHGSEARQGGRQGGQ